MDKGDKMKQLSDNIVHQEKVSIGPLWYIIVGLVAILSVYLINQSPMASIPVVIGAFLIILVETVFTYPIRYFLTDKGLIAKSGLIFKHEIGFDEIEEIEVINWYKLYFYVGGNRIAGMPKDKVIIINPKTDRLIITPDKEIMNYLLEHTNLG